MPKQYPAAPPMSIDANKKYTATFETSRGNIVCELFAQDAPKTVNNFVSLAKDGFETRLQKNAAILKDHDLRRSAFVMAVGIAYIDGEVDDAEIDVFTALAKHYEIPMEEAQTLLEQVENDLLGPAD